MQYKEFYRNKRVLVIGAASGIGMEIVRQLMDCGAELFLTARTASKLKTIFGPDSGMTYIELELGRAGETARVFGELKKNAGTIDIVINLAGHDVFKDFSSISEDDIRTTFSINVEETVLLVKYAVEILFENSQGVLVNINAFVGGRLSMPYFSIDSASRAAVANLFRSLRREYGENDIRFVLFSPPGVATEAEKAERGKIWKKTGVRLAEPSKIAASFLRRLARGRNNIILAGPDERMLAFLDTYWPPLADRLYFKGFIKKISGK